MRVSKVFSFFLFAPLFIILIGSCNAKDNEEIILKEKYDKNALISNNEYFYSYANILDKATPAVVSVYTSMYVKSYQNQMHPYMDLFRQFGFPIPDSYDNSTSPNESNEEELRPLGAGSGVIMTENGYILTNHHVVHDQRNQLVDEIKVRLDDGREFVAEFIGSDQKTDVAVLKIDGSESLFPIAVGDSDHIRVGDIVFAIGNPLRVGTTATQGIVSGKGRQIGILKGGYENFIQTDASINMGNSGGALVDAFGNLIGINTAIFSGDGGSIGIGFAIPINMARDVMKKIINIGEVPRGLLGLYPEDITSELAEAFKLEDTRGALITEVQKGSPADVAGIMHGDVIIKIDDIIIESATDLRLKVSQMSPGQKVLVSLIRDGKVELIKVVLGSVGDDYSSVDSANIFQGMHISLLDEKLRDELSVPKKINGLVVTKVDKDSPFYRVVSPNTIIIEINGFQLNEPNQIKDFIEEGKANRLYVWYNGRIRYLVLRY